MVSPTIHPPYGLELNRGKQIGTAHFYFIICGFWHLRQKQVSTLELDDEPRVTCHEAPLCTGFPPKIGDQRTDEIPDSKGNQTGS
jgi:hypothetical protein